MKKIAIVALAAAATFITSCDIERLPYDKYTEDKIMEDKDAAVSSRGITFVRINRQPIRSVLILPISIR